MKRLFCLLLALCLVGALAACAPSEDKLQEQLKVLVMQDAVNQLQDASYYRVAIDTLESCGKNQWSATGNVSYTNTAGYTTAVLYTTTLRYDADAKKFSTKTVFGEFYQIP